MFLGLQMACDPMGFCLIDKTGSVLISQQQTHTADFCEQLTYSIKQSFDSVGASFSDITAIGVSKGPGSYTALRVGATFANTLSQIYEIPLYGFSTFEILTYPYREIDGLYLPMIQARKQELSMAVLGFDKGKMNVQNLFSVLTHPHAVSFLSKFKGKAHVLGKIPDAVYRLNPHLSYTPCSPSASDVGHLTFQTFQNQISSSKYLIPTYAYQSV